LHSLKEEARMRTAFDPRSVAELASLITALEEELTFDGPLNSITRMALARRVVDVAAAGEIDPDRIRARVLNRPTDEARVSAVHRVATSTLG
jgi:hypothetical protein